MIDGKSGGSGRYSYRETSSGNQSVMVSHMPEDCFQVRIVIRHNGETAIPIIKMSETEAGLLLASLTQMAQDLKWDMRDWKERYEEIKDKAGTP